MYPRLKARVHLKPEGNHEGRKITLHLCNASEKSEVKCSPFSEKKPQNLQVDQRNFLLTHMVYIAHVLCTRFWSVGNVHMLEENPKILIIIILIIQISTLSWSPFQPWQQVGLEIKLFNFHGQSKTACLKLVLITIGDHWCLYVNVMRSLTSNFNGIYM